MEEVVGPDAHAVSHTHPDWQLTSEEWDADTRTLYQRWEIPQADGTVYVMNADRVNPRARTSTPPDGAQRMVLRP